ncbi:MAG: VOC family protein [Rhodospirillales bacterium]|nr:VOC family protein [Rhodospirillales bacterium]
MLDHVGIEVRDFRKARPLRGDLGATGLELVTEAGGWGASPVGTTQETIQTVQSFWIHRAAGSPSRVHIAFRAQERAQVHTFWRAGLRAGGRDNGAPGIRAHYHLDYFGAFLLDPNGHNIEAVCHAAQ